MSNLMDRPFVGTWRLNNKKVIRYTPDALVYLNGDTSLPGCATCNGRIDLQPYIREVSVDPTVEGMATASFSLHLPYHMGDSFVRDGNFLVHPGLEVHIYFRGYFPTTGILSGTTPDQTGGVDLSDAIMYPYYMVFHGVVKNVAVTLFGTEQTVSVTCEDLLTFWQYQLISTNGSVFGARPSDSKVNMSLYGHNFTGMSPYAIIYTLFRDVGGAAGGVAFALSNETNAAAMSTVSQQSQFSYNLLYWSKRFSQSMTSLRMYGPNGNLYNAMQAAFLASLSTDQVVTLGRKYADVNGSRTEFDPLLKKAAAVGFDPYTLYSGALSDEDTGSLGVNAAQMEAFVQDLGSTGTVNFFESVYQTKMDIANTVKEVSGFEFYQDVDGDIVYKPPFYNLDTSGSRVYRIEDEDIISFSTTEAEPECTHIKGTGSYFRNLKGTGLEGEWGVRAEFIDYRLVAQFGWREKTFESSYYTNQRSMFYACIAKMDLFNINRNSASCSIPLRPELRPGYPVYIVALDCFYYVTSLSHSFSFGGQCVTNLNLVGKRAKFYAPGRTNGNGSPATVDDIDLSDPHKAPLPLEGKVEGSPGKLMGFPNVVMTLDPELVNPLTFFRGLTATELQNVDNIKTLIHMIMMGRTGILEVAGDQSADSKSQYFDGPWRLKTGEGTYIEITLDQLVSQAQSLQKSLGVVSGSDAIAKVSNDPNYTEFVSLIEAARTVADKVDPNVSATANYLDLLSDYKASFNPGSTLPGYYRYYSASHWDPTQQGALQLTTDDQGMVHAGSPFIVGDLDLKKPVLQFRQTSTELVPVEANTIKGGIPLLKPGSNQVQVTPTHLITNIQIASFDVSYSNGKVTTLGVHSEGFPVPPLATAYSGYFAQLLKQDTPLESTPLSTYQSIYSQQAEWVKKQVTLQGETVVSASSSWNTTSFVAALQEKVPDIPIRLNSSFRTPAQQAAAMLEKIRLGDDLKALYKDKALVQEILDVPCAQDRSTCTSPSCVAAVTAVIQAQVDRGQYISQHMSGTAIDVNITSPVMSESQINRVIAAAGALGAKAIHETTPPHIHIQSTGSLSSPPAQPSGAYTVGDFAYPVSPETQVVGDLAGDTAEDKLDAWASVLGQALAVAASTTLTNLKSGIASGSVKSTATDADLSAAWASIFPDAHRIQSSKQKKQTKQTVKQVRQHKVPVFPVSDAQGYTVVGTYRYGRGLSVETGGSFSQLQNVSLASNTSFDAAEEILNTLSNGIDNVTNMDPKKRAALASQLGGVDLVTENGRILVLDTSSREGLQYGNTPANTNQATQKLTVVNAAYSLGDLLSSEGKTVCSCKGAEAGIDLLAFAGDEGNFMSVETEGVTTWLKAQAEKTTQTWAVNQNAYSGVVSTKPQG